MWISKYEFRRMQSAIEDLRNDIRALRESRSLILEHIGMCQVLEPSTPAKQVLITKKQAEKRNKGIINAYSNCGIGVYSPLNTGNLSFISGGPNVSIGGLS